MYEDELFSSLDRSLDTSYFYQGISKPSARNISKPAPTTAQSKKKSGTDWSMLAGAVSAGLGAYNSGKRSSGSSFEERNRNIDPLKQKREEQNKQIDQTGTAIASNLGPWWGLLSEAGLAASDEIRGDGSNYDENVQANFTDPFNQFKNNEDVDDWIGSFLAPTASAHIKAERQTAEFEKEQTRKMNMQRDRSKVSGAKFQNSLDRYTAPQYGRNGLKIRKTKLSYGTKSY